MDFGLSDEQRMFDQTLRNFLAQRVSMTTRREAAKTGIDNTLWQGLVGLGVAGLLVPDAEGGAGLGLLDAAVVAEALGHAAAPSWFVGSGVIAPLALRWCGDATQRQHWLPQLAGGRMRVACAFGPLAGTVGRCTLTLAGDRLSGEISGALDGAGATHLLVALPDGRMALAAADAAGVTLRLRRSVDRLRPLADLKFDAAKVEILGSGNAADVGRVLDAARVVLAAETLGAAQAMLEQAVEYAKQREQFGRAIASFQGVKHACAEMVTMSEPARAFVWYAAFQQDERDDEAHMLACQLKAHVDDIGREVARIATEVHGGVGFTDLLGLHFWFKRIMANRQLLGAPERCRHDAAVALKFIAA